jgi:hypothetical protein
MAPSETVPHHFFTAVLLSCAHRRRELPVVAGERVVGRVARPAGCVGPTRILYGESYAGLFVLDAFARGRQLFTDYISVSPTVGVWPEGLAVALRQRMSAGASPATRAGDAASASSLFVIFGEKDAPLVTDYMPSVAQLVEAEHPPTLRFGVEILPRAGHNPPESLDRGLRFVFDVRR